MFGLSFSEIIVIGIIALIVIGPKELPVVARAIGRALNELKRASGSFFDELKSISPESKQEIKLRVPRLPKTPTLPKLGSFPHIEDGSDDDEPIKVVEHIVDKEPTKVAEHNTTPPGIIASSPIVEEKIPQLEPSKNKEIDHGV